MTKDQKNAYKQAYDNEHYERINLKLSPDNAGLIRDAANRYGMSYSQFVLACVKEFLANRENHDG